jgi:hypothetical protein
MSAGSPRSEVRNHSACQIRQRCRTWQRASALDRGLGAARALQCGAVHKEPTMKTLILSTVLSLTLVAGCKKKESDCEAIYAHTMSLLPAELKGDLKEDKADAIAKCEKLSPEARKCALGAKSLEDLMKCPRS